MGGRGMRFGILGPLEIRRDDDSDLALTGLAVERSCFDCWSTPTGVSTSMLCDDVWDGSPPAGAAQTLQSHVSHLRKVLDPERVRTQGAAYLVAVGRHDLDSLCFEDELASACALMDDGDVGRVLTEFPMALRRWRGDPLEEVAHKPWAMAEAARLSAASLRQRGPP